VTTVVASSSSFGAVTVLLPLPIKALWINASANGKIGATAIAGPRRLRVVVAIA
jgi:hypothetical protein